MKRKVKEGRVSVIFPIYGSFDFRRTLIAIDSVRFQEDVDVEVVVSEQGECPKIKDGLGADIKYTFREHHSSLELSDFNPGQVRNLGAIISTGEFLYTNDADVALLNPTFLRNVLYLLQQNRELALYRPPMRRLPLECFEEFESIVRERGFVSAIDSLDFYQKYLVTTDRKERKLKVVTKMSEYEKTFTTSFENFQRYILDPSLKGKEPMIWTEDRHAGGIFMRREQFDLVGGYCQEFINWGCEDSDLQWKLGQVFDLQLFPKQPEYEVLHLDHPRGYFSPEMWRKNEEVSKGRKEKGVIVAINDDIKYGKIQHE